jgi:glucose/arabinose dehydrogenase
MRRTRHRPVPGQTRAPEARKDVAFEVVTVAEGLEKPWGLTFLPGGKMLVTEKAGRLRVVTPDGKLSEPVAGLPAVDNRGQGGLLDIALDPRYASNRLIYWSYSEPGAEDVNNTAVARGKFVDEAAPRVDEVKVITTGHRQTRIKATSPRTAARATTAAARRRSMDRLF